MDTQQPSPACHPEHHATHEPPSPWACRALNFLRAAQQLGVGSLTLGDLRPMFELAPRGELALTVDALCALDCLLPQADGSFRVGAALQEIAPRPSRFAMTAGRLRGHGVSRES